MENGNGAAQGSRASRECYTAKEVAVKLGITYNTLIAWMNRPKRKQQLPPFKTFGTVKCGVTYAFPIKEFNKWLENN